MAEDDVMLIAAPETEAMEGWVLEGSVGPSQFSNKKAVKGF